MEGKADYTAKAKLGKKSRTKAIVIIAVISLFVALGIFLTVCNIFAGKYLFCIGYLIASVLGLCYVVIEINSIFATFLAADKQHIYMKNWVNGFVPFDLKHKLGFVREFIPAKTTTVEIKMADVKECMMGSSSFLKRHCSDNKNFIDKLVDFEEMGVVNKSRIKRMDYFYIETKSGESCFMPVTGFDEDELAKVVYQIEKSSKIEVRCNNHDIVKKCELLKMKI